MAGGKAMGRRGGMATKERHDPDYFRRIGSMGGKALKAIREAPAEADRLFDEAGNRRVVESPRFDDAE